MSINSLSKLLKAMYWPLMLAALTGCATDIWQPVGDANVRREFSQQIDFELPKNWVELVIPTQFERVDITRDGPGLQWITVEFRRGPKMVPELTQSTVSAPTLLQLAEWEQALTLREPGLLNAVLESTKKGQVAGHEAIVMVYRYRSAVGADYRRIAYVCADKRGYLRLSLHAPVGHYLNNARSTLDALVKSVRWSEKM